jgi:hypothetical protein
MDRGVGGGGNSKSNKFIKCRFWLGVAGMFDEPPFAGERWF